MNPFEVIKSFFNSNWKTVTTIDKSKNFFMINRICSIQFPVQANYFNHIKISPPEVIDFWKPPPSSKYISSPSWTWTKTAKKENQKKKAAYKEEVIIFIKEKNNISNREIEELKEFFPQKFEEYYKDVEDLLS